MRKRILPLGPLCAALAAPSLRLHDQALPPVPRRSTTLSAPADPAHFTFVVGGDNRSTGMATRCRPSLGVICREIGTIQPDFVFWTGDVIEGYGDTPAEANAEYDMFLRAAAQTGVPVFNAPGNHEYSLDPALLPVYEKRMGPLYGSFDYGNSHFIASTPPVEPDGTIGGATLDDDRVGLAGSRPAGQPGGEEHLRHDAPLRLRPARPGHARRRYRLEQRRRPRPASRADGQVPRPRRLLQPQPHLLAPAKDGVDYYISGGAGAPLDATPDQGGYLHYLLVTVDGATVTPQILQPWHLDVGPDGRRRGRPPNGSGSSTPTTFQSWQTSSSTWPRRPAGQTWRSTAGVAYKREFKPSRARIVSVDAENGRRATSSSRG